MEQFAQLPMQPSLAQCPYCITETQVKVHSHKERRYRCCTCRSTFSERYGTPLLLRQEECSYQLVDFARPYCSLLSTDVLRKLGN